MTDSQYFQPEAEHTPGPWTHELQSGSEYIYEVMAAGYYVATAHDGAMGKSNAEANARLIAAAPDLLEALQEAAVLIEGVLMIHGTPEADSTGHKVRAAIAKTTGNAA